MQKRPGSFHSGFSSPIWFQRIICRPICRTFFGGVLLDGDLGTSAGLFLYYLKNLPPAELGFRLAASPLFPLKWPLPYLQTPFARERV